MNPFLLLKKYRSILSLTGIFLIIYMLSAMNFKSIGDDYVYSFIWEGHSLYTPLSEYPERIASFGDIARSSYLYYMTWGGRVVAQAMAMFFLWMDKNVFNISIAAGTVLMICLMHWLSMEGNIKRKGYFFYIAFIFFCFWSFNINFAGTVLWIDGACNYFFPAVFLLIFLLPYVRHYFTDGKVDYSPAFGIQVFLLGLLAGDSNENTICWIILSGIVYLYSSYKRRCLQPWMIAGLLGLAIGYVILLLSPGNFIRMSESGESFRLLFLDKSHFMAIGFCLFVQSFLWIYLIKFYRRRSFFYSCKNTSKYIHFTVWLGMMSLGFNIIMFLSPESPFRTAFPSLLFLIIAVMTAIHLSNLSGVRIIKKKSSHILTMMGILYFCITLSNTCLFYSQEHVYMESIIQQARLLRGSEKILEVKPAWYATERNWGLFTGLHAAYSNPFYRDMNHWKNVAFARYFGIKGVRMVDDCEETNRDETF
jgi:hypothetical protein